MDPKEAALRLLARREHSSRELFAKLQQRGFGPEEIESALEWLKRRRFLSDERYAACFWAWRAGQGYSDAWIEAALEQKGVPAEARIAGRERLARDFPELREEKERLRRLLGRLQSRQGGAGLNPRDPKAFRRIFSRALRHGYEAEQVREAMGMEDAA